MIDSSKATVVWDWNGTLINDIEICIQSMNLLMQKRGIKELTIEKYREIFTFPVKDYYEDAGFNFSEEPFEIPAMEFIDNYHKFLPQVRLFSEVEQTLKLVKQKGFNQVILSAMEENSLKNSVEALGITKYFDGIYGITDHYARSKSNRGFQLIKDGNLDVKSLVLIGDTLHDKEVADELGCSCILIANGHQAKNRLQVNGNIVVNRISDAFPLLSGLLEFS